MLACPRCRVRLRSERQPRGVDWVCDHCAGRVVGMDELRGITRSEFAFNRWRSISADDPDSGLTCPACASAMHNTTAQLADAEVIVDTCAKCRIAWLDERKPEPLPEVRGARAYEPPSATARTAMALFEVRLRQDEAKAREVVEPPDEFWKRIVAMLGFPVEIEGNIELRTPLVTWALALLLTEAWLFSLSDPPSAFANFGFVASQPLRVHGLTSLSYVFVHAGWFHLLGNVYFLVTFGRRVEALLGRWMYIALVILAAIASAASHTLLTKRPDLPLVGASGAISGVIAYYAVSSPRAKFAVFVWFGSWLRLPAAMWFVIWIFLQLLYADLGSDAVAHGSHLGGALCGLVAAFLARYVGASRPDASKLNGAGSE